MKKIIYGILATISGLVLLLSYRTSLGESVGSDLAQTTGSPTTAHTTPGTSGTSATATPSPNGSGSSSSPTAASGTTGSTTSSDSALTDGTYTGAAADTRYGPVAVRIIVAGGVVTDVQVPTFPSGNSRDRQINEQAIPRLVSETLTAQSAQIDMVSGATYTSDGYVRSLQSALDQAAA
jgi:uncharacterized protein with FMN-binding domain